MRLGIKWSIVFFCLYSPSFAQKLDQTKSDASYGSGFSLYMVFADDYEARSGAENSISSQEQAYGVDLGYHFNFLSHFRVNPSLNYRYIRFTNMTSNVNTNRAATLGVASTISLDWSPPSGESLLRKSKWYIPLYLLKIGAGFNVIRFSDPQNTITPAFFYSVGVGFPFKRFSFHVGGEGNMLVHQDFFTELDGYRLRIGYRF